MKKISLLLILPLSFLSHCQSWQWGKRGGATEPLNTSTQRQEETYFLITDSQKNVYGLSTVGYAGLNIDGNVKSNFDSFSAPIDIALFSFACNGSYRWSKIIGGIGVETLETIAVDSQDNVYIAGRLGQCNYPAFPPRIDDDFISSQSPADCRRMFIAKYDTNGVLQWLKRPQAVSVSQSDDSAVIARALVTDAAGNLYWLVGLPPGTYADGAFVNNMAGTNFFILKYDLQGNYTGNIPIDIQTTETFGNLNFYRNPHNGYFYIVSGKSNGSATAVVAGNTVTHATFMACFDTQGNYLWKRENTAVDSGTLYVYNLDFDAQNNIYIGGKMVGFNGESFLGYAPPAFESPGFVMKANPDASLVLWSSNSNTPSENYGAIVLNGNELAYTSYCGGPNFAWGSQTLNVNSLGSGTEVLLARFNATSGTCTGLSNIPGNTGYNDVGTAITADLSGDYILGGAMGGTLNFNNNQQIINGGSQSDFFVAKYATEACSPLGIADHTVLTLSIYPNPTKGVVTFDNTMAHFQKVSVYNYLGKVLLTQSISDSNFETIDLSGLPNGVYLLQFESEQGIFNAKVVKE